MDGIARVWTSARLGVQTRVRLARMRPRRRRAVAALVRGVLAAGGPELAGGVAGGRSVARSGRRVLVVAHVHYPQLWPELAGHVARIAGPFDLTVTLTPPAAALAPLIAEQFPGARVIPVPNRGRDLAPLLTVLAATPGLGDYAAVLKVHTKRSPHRRTGDAWRSALLADLCPGPRAIEEILDVLTEGRAPGVDPDAVAGAGSADASPRVGMVAANGSVLGREFLGPNTRTVAELVRRAGLRLESDRLWFPAGAMFWARPQVLADLLAPGLSTEDFEAEPTPPDGTLAHALERYLGVALAARDLGVLEVGELPGGPTMAP